MECPIELATAGAAAATAAVASGVDVCASTLWDARGVAGTKAGVVVTGISCVAMIVAAGVVAVDAIVAAKAAVPAGGDRTACRTGVVADSVSIAGTWGAVVATGSRGATGG
jgi:hypothetical protein